MLQIVIGRRLCYVDLLHPESNRPQRKSSPSVDTLLLLFDFGIRRVGERGKLRFFFFPLSSLSPVHLGNKK